MSNYVYGHLQREAGLLRAIVVFDDGDVGGLKVVTMT
jgi:hypothetical protein